MTNSSTPYYSEDDDEFEFVTETSDLDELFDEPSLTEGDDLDELFVESSFTELNDDEIFGNDEDTLNDFDDDPLSRITKEINRDVRGMDESEAVDYMQDRMGEVLPLLASVLPSLISLAPSAINAIASLFHSRPSNTNPSASTVPPLSSSNQRPQNYPATHSPVPASSTNASTVPTNPASLASSGSSSVSGTGNTTSQLLTALLSLIQHPAVSQMLTGMISGAGQAVTGNSGQQINAGNVLGVLSSLAGTLAGNTGNAGGGNRESRFPEYAISSEGTFVIDPHNSIEEAELILDLLK